MCFRPARELISVDTENWNSFKFVVCSNLEAPLGVFLIGINEVKRYCIRRRKKDPALLPDNKSPAEIQDIWGEINEIWV